MVNVLHDDTIESGDRMNDTLSSSIGTELENTENGDCHATPASDSQEPGGTPPPAPGSGRLQPIAAKVLMKILYAAVSACCMLFVIWRLSSPNGRPSVTASFIDLRVTLTHPNISI